MCYVAGVGMTGFVITTAKFFKFFMLVVFMKTILKSDVVVIVAVFGLSVFLLLLYSILSLVLFLMAISSKLNKVLIIDVFVSLFFQENSEGG